MGIGGLGVGMSWVWGSGRRGGGCGLLEVQVASDMR